MSEDRYLIISADAHAGLPAEGYRPYLDAAYHPQFDEYLAERHANRDELLKMNYDYIMGWETDNEEGLRGAWDIDQRDKELDADGVTAEVMFADADAITGMASPPFGAGLSAGAIADPELAFAGARAHNRFLAEMCSRSPERHGGIALVPITHSIERSVAEIEWLAEQPGIRGIMVPTMWHDLLPYNHPDYDPVWAACQEVGFPVHTHSGEAPQEEYNDNVGIYLAEVVWWAARPMWHLLFSGAFERFPRLKYVVTEAAAYWAADMMWKWDQYMGGGHTTKKMAALLKGKISKLPSDYFGENIFIGASTMSKEEIRRRHILGCDVVMWGTDYPHPEGTWPHTQERLRGDFGGIPVEDARKLLGETAARCYDFDLDALRPIADRIGPTPAGPRSGPRAAHRPRGGAHGALVEGRVPGPAAGLNVPLMNPGHMEYCASDDWRQLVHETILPVALAGVTLGDDALEIGPGPGFTTDILQHQDGASDGCRARRGPGGRAGRADGRRPTWRSSSAMPRRWTSRRSASRVRRRSTCSITLRPPRPRTGSSPSWPGCSSPGRRWWRPTASTARAARPSTRTTPTTRSTRRSWSRGSAPPASARCGCARTTSDGCARPD